jgi:hypothetical protein
MAVKSENKRWIGRGGFSRIHGIFLKKAPSSEPCQQFADGGALPLLFRFVPIHPTMFALKVTSRAVGGCHHRYQVALVSASNRKSAIHANHHAV